MRALLAASLFPALCAHGSGNADVSNRSPPNASFLAAPWVLAVLSSDPPLVAAPDGAARGALEIDCVEAGAEIWLDGNDTGRKTPAVIDRLLEGEYDVEVRWGARRGRRAATVQPGQLAGVHVKLADQALVHVESDPAKAQISLDGVEQGAAPVDLVVSRGQHRLTASLRGYSVASAPVSPELETVRLSLPRHDWAITWSLLWPQFELSRRLGERTWLGGRLEGGAVAIDPGADACGDVGVPQFFSVSALIHWRFEAPEALLGAEVYGGPIVAYLQHIPDRFRCANADEALVGTALGVSGRIGPFTLEVEGQFGEIRGKINAFILPQLAVRHTF